MPDDKKKVTDPDDQTVKVQETGFPEEYVQKLRRENASRRSDQLDTEKRMDILEETIKQHIVTIDVNAELTKRNLSIEPGWIKIEEGKSVVDAVDTFLKKYPQFESKSETTEITPKKETTEIKPEVKNVQEEKSTQKPMSTKKINTNLQPGKVSDIRAIKNDPVARAKLRDHYQSLTRVRGNT